MNNTAPPPFLPKLYELVSDPSTEDLCSWSEDGKQFTVHKVTEFARDVLPKYFKHNNFSSFVRQLNQYGFHKRDPDQWTFGHENFIKGDKNKLLEISRKRGKNVRQNHQVSQQQYQQQQQMQLQLQQLHEIQQNNQHHQHLQQQNNQLATSVNHSHIVNPNSHKINPNNTFNAGHTSQTFQRLPYYGDPYIQNTVAQKLPHEYHSSVPDIPIHDKNNSQAVIEIGNYGVLGGEVETLRRDKDLLMRELILSREKENALREKCEQNESRIQALENNMHQMQSFMYQYFSTVLNGYGGGSRKKKRLPPPTHEPERNTNNNQVLTLSTNVIPSNMDMDSLQQMLNQIFPETSTSGGLKGKAKSFEGSSFKSRVEEEICEEGTSGARISEVEFPPAYIQELKDIQPSTKSNLTSKPVREPSIANHSENSIKSPTRSIHHANLTIEDAPSASYTVPLNMTSVVPPISPSENLAPDSTLPETQDFSHLLQMDNINTNLQDTTGTSEDFDFLLNGICPIESIPPVDFDLLTNHMSDGHEN